ncbi:MAG: hypothetical protein JXR68_07020 [Bacteroidales bacterium]|nr:hypothetical protein [Bacteroidales bacterium]
MKKILFSIIFVFIMANSAHAQIDSLISYCNAYLQYPYISDGQQYRSILTQGEVAEFRMTFFGGATYRIVAASEPADESVIFRLYDQNRNELFSNVNYNQSTYWDFKFTSTLECFIEAELPQGKPSGFVIMFIGFKQ